jgi:hypothetical protein
LTEVFLTLTEVFPYFFLSYNADARVKFAKTGHGPHSSTLAVICVVQLLFVLLYVLFVAHAIAQLVEALRYKSERRGFDSRWCHYNFLLTQFFRPHYGPGVDSAFKRNDYQEYFLGVKSSGA